MKHDMSRAGGPARLEVELDRRGRHVGALFVPHSHDRSAYGRITLPVIVVKGGDGPTLLCTAGLHGDEYEGQFALSRLARTLDPDRLRGRVILLPVANPAASAASRRTSPIDRVNLARCFPGRPDGQPTEQIADGIFRLLLQLADCVVDLHSGGGTLDYLPCAFGRLPVDGALARRALDLMLAFGAPHAMVMRNPEASATLVSAALDQGIPAMATELGGGGGVTPRTVEIARAGIENVLAHLGMTDTAATPRAKTRLLAIEPKGFLRAPGRGAFEPIHALGETVEVGETAGWLWDFERADRAPEPLLIPDDGMVVCRRVPPICRAADVLLHLGRDTTPAELLGIA